MAAYSGASFTTVSVYTDSTLGTLSAIYEDSGLTLPASNPFKAYGNYTFYAAAGQYVVYGDFTKVDPYPAVTFANLPTTPTLGDLRAITDSNTAVWGATIAGGGANQVLGWWNGTNWTVVGT